MTRFARSPVRRLPLIGCLALLTASPATAQVLDYSTLEHIFREPVTTSATGTPQRASDAPANMVILTRDDIRRSGATSIPEALQFVPGVDVRWYGLADAEVGIRGYNQAYNNRLLVLVNGRQVYSDDYGHVIWASIPIQIEEIRQIEVIKGPNSALYGFNAVSGVINIITFDPLRDRINAVTVRGGTQDYLGASIVGTARIEDRAGLRVSIGGIRAQDFPSGPISATGTVSRQNPAIGAFNIDTRFHLAPGVEAFAEGSMSDSRYAEKSFTATFDTGFVRTDSLRAGVSADTALGLFSLSAYHNGQHLSVGGLETLGVGLATWVTTDLYVVQASDLLKLGTDHVLRLGLEYRDDAVTAPGFIRGTIGYTVRAASVMWNWRITPELSLTNAVRIDDLHLRYSGSPAPGSGFTLPDYNHAGVTVPSFNSGLVFKPTTRDTFRVMVARGVQLPSLVDFGLQFPAGAIGAPVVVAGNPNVDPSTVDSIELDYDRALPVIGSNLRLALYAQRNRDLISPPFGLQPVIGPAGLPVLTSGNIGDSDAIGGELGIEGHAGSGLRWRFSYAFVATTDDTVLNRGGSLTSAIDYAHSVPRHVVTAGIGYTADRWEMDLLGGWQSSYRDFTSPSSSLVLQPVEVRNYLTLNGRIAYRLTDNVTAAVTARQFNTSRLLRAGGPPTERQIIGQIAASF